MISKFQIHQYSQEYCQATYKESGLANDSYFQSSKFDVYIYCKIAQLGTSERQGQNGKSHNSQQPLPAQHWWMYPELKPIGWWRNSPCN